MNVNGTPYSQPDEATYRLFSIVLLTFAFPFSKRLLDANAYFRTPAKQRTPPSNYRLGAACHWAWQALLCIIFALAWLSGATRSPLSSPAALCLFGLYFFPAAALLWSYVAYHKRLAASDPHSVVYLATTFALLDTFIPQAIMVAITLVLSLLFSLDHLGPLIVAFAIAAAYPFTATPAAPYGVPLANFIFHELYHHYNQGRGQATGSLLPSIFKSPVVHNVLTWIALYAAALLAPGT